MEEEDQRYIAQPHLCICQENTPTMLTPFHYQESNRFSADTTLHSPNTHRMSHHQVEAIILDQSIDHFLSNDVEYLACLHMMKYPQFSSWLPTCHIHPWYVRGEPQQQSLASKIVCTGRLSYRVVYEVHHHISCSRQLRGRIWFPSAPDAVSSNGRPYHWAISTEQLWTAEYILCDQYARHLSIQQ